MIVRPLQESDMCALLVIHNDAVAHTTAIWSNEVSDRAERLAWLAQKRAASLPVLAAEADGRLVGYASYGPFRAWPSYARTVEHSVYVARDARRQGVARALVQALISTARASGVHAMVAGIEAGNTASVALHQALGFEFAGTLREVGHKFGAWLDLTFMVRRLDDEVCPATPESNRDRTFSVAAS